MITQTIGGNTYTCDLTQLAVTFGANQDDQFVDAVIDRMGNIYATGVTYSPAFAVGGDQDVVVMKLDSSTLSHQRSDGGWSLAWGGPLFEMATSITVDDNL